MFYKACLGLALAIATFSLISAFSSARSVSLRQQNFVDDSARRYTRSTYIVPIPYNAGGGYGGGGYVGGSSGGSGGGGGSSRSDYDNYRGGGPGTGK